MFNHVISKSLEKRLNKAKLIISGATVIVMSIVIHSAMFIKKMARWLHISGIPSSEIVMEFLFSVFGGLPHMT